MVPAAAGVRLTRPVSTPTARLFAGIFCMLALFSSPVRATLPGERGAAGDVWYIEPDGTGTVPTILDALQQADDGDTLILADGIFSGPGNRDLDCQGKSLTIYSESGDPAACTIDLGGSESDPHCGFYFNGTQGSSGSIRGITLRNGYTADSSLTRCGGALYSRSYDMEIVDCRFEDNTAEGGGGACLYPAPLTMTNCEFTGNTAGNAGACGIVLAA